jgi:hypothetical protein
MLEFENILENPKTSRNLYKDSPIRYVNNLIYAKSPDRKSLDDTEVYMSIYKKSQELYLYCTAVKELCQKENVETEFVRVNQNIPLERLTCPYARKHIAYQPFVNADVVYVRLQNLLGYELYLKINMAYKQCYIYTSPDMDRTIEPDLFSARESDRDIAKEESKDWIEQAAKINLKLINESIDFVNALMDFVLVHEEELLDESAYTEK